jgi:hypothetical protein
LERTIGDFCHLTRIGFHHLFRSVTGTRWDMNWGRKTMLNLESLIDKAFNMACVAKQLTQTAYYHPMGIETPVTLMAAHLAAKTPELLGELIGYGYDETLDAESIDEQLAEALGTAEKAVTWNDKAHRRDDSEQARLARWTLEQTVILIKQAREAIVRQGQLEAA